MLAYRFWRFIMLSTIMLVFSIVLCVIIALGGLIGFFKGWKKCLIGLCRTLAAAILSFVIVLIICTSLPGHTLFSIVESFIGDVEFISGSDATQDFIGNVVYSVVMPFVFVWIFVILDLLLLIPAHFIGKALGCHSKKEKPNDVPVQAEESESDTEEEVSPDMAEDIPVKQSDSQAYVPAAEEKKPNIGFNFIGAGIKMVTTTLVILLIMLPITGIIRTFADGIDNIVNTATSLETKVDIDSPDLDILGYTVTDSEGVLDLTALNGLLDEYFHPVTNNVFVVMSSKGPMRLVYNGLTGASVNTDGKLKNEFDQIFDLCSDAIYLTVDFEKYDDSQKAAVNRIFDYLSKSDSHCAVVADILSYFATNAIEEKESVTDGTPASILTDPLFEILANTNPERVKTDIETIRDAIIVVLDYKLPAEFAAAMAKDDITAAYHVFANENMLGDVLLLLYHNEDFHDLTAPSVNFIFTSLIRTINHKVESVNVTDAHINSLTDEELRTEAKVLASLIDHINSVTQTVKILSESSDAMDAVASADMAAIGSFAEIAQGSIFLGEGVNELLVAMLSSESFNSMREVSDILIYHIENDDDLHIKNLMVATQQFVNILNIYDKGEGYDTAELAVTLGELNKTLDPSTAAIMKEIINDTNILTSTSLDAGGKENTSSQKMMSVFVEKLSTEEFTEEELEKEAKALDYSMQLIQASNSEDDNALKNIYNDKEGMNEMIGTMADSKISSAAINEIAYVDGNPDNGLSEDALEISDSMDEEDRTTLVEECETYYKQEAVKEGCDITTLQTNVKAIAAVFGEDITENMANWDSELAN